METPETKLAGGVTKGQAEKWKKAHGSVHIVEVDISENQDGSEIVTGYFRKPTLQDMEMAQAASGGARLKASKIVTKNCFLGGDNAVIENDEAMIATIKVVDTLFRQLQANLKKL